MEPSPPVEKQGSETIDRRLNVFGKILWTFTFILSILICSYFITKIYDKWNTSPVIVSIAEQPVSAGAIPLPAITICPQLKSKASIYNFTKYTYEVRNKNNNMSRADFEEYNDIATLCQYRFNGNNQTRVTNLTIIDRINKVSPNLNDIIYLCKVTGIFGIKLCNVLFAETYTSEGKCITFNSISAKELYRDNVVRNTNAKIRSQRWSLKGGYEVDEGEKLAVYPMRGVINSNEPDMSIYLQQEIIDEELLCNGMKTGYKIYFGHPVDAPQSSPYYYTATADRLTSLAINVEIFTASESLRKYPVHKRQCYFPDEKYLAYYKLYSYSNCVLECVSNITQSMCNCVGFFMPYFSNVKRVICTYDDEKCMERAHREMIRYESKRNTKSACRCLPTCDSVEYDAEVLKTEYKVPEYDQLIMKIQGYNYNLVNETKYSTIELYFKKPQFWAKHRSELFGLTDFIANIGGLLGVFLGFSFLSLIKILYSIFLWIAVTMKKNFNNEKISNE